MNLQVMIALCMAVSFAYVERPAEADGLERSWALIDIKGSEHKPFDDESTKGVVLLFISTDCPIANGYQPLLQRLQETYANKGILFFMVHPGGGTSLEEARKHADEFGILAPVVLDSDLAIARRFNATTMPEAILLVRDDSKPVYQGRIDNRYAGFGKRRAVVTSHDLDNALRAVATGRLPKVAKTEAIGCRIYFPVSPERVP